MGPAVWPDPAERGRQMLRWQADDRRSDGARATSGLRADVSRFLVESEQRVAAYCHAMLARDDLAADERDRLVRLLAEADRRLQRLLTAAA